MRIEVELGVACALGMLVWLIRAGGEEGAAGGRQYTQADTQAAREQAKYQANNRWPRGCRRPCGSLMTPGVGHYNERHGYYRQDETDHCFPEDNADHYVCCVNITNPANEYNTHDNRVARHNPLFGPIMRNSYDPNNLSWCTCTREICERQLGGKVEWEGC